MAERILSPSDSKAMVPQPGEPQNLDDLSTASQFSLVYCHTNVKSSETELSTLVSYCVILKILCMGKEEAHQEFIVSLSETLKKQIIISPDLIATEKRKIIM